MLWCELSVNNKKGKVLSIPNDGVAENGSCSELNALSSLVYDQKASLSALTIYSRSVILVPVFQSVKCEAWMKWPTAYKDYALHIHSKVNLLKPINCLYGINLLTHIRWLSGWRLAVCSNALLTGAGFAFILTMLMYAVKCLALVCNISWRVDMNEWSKFVSIILMTQCIALVAVCFGFSNYVSPLGRPLSITSIKRASSMIKT